MEEEKLILSEQDEKEDMEIKPKLPLVVQSNISISDPQYKPQPGLIIRDRKVNQTVFIPEIGWL